GWVRTAGRDRLLHVAQKRRFDRPSSELFPRVVPSTTLARHSRASVRPPTGAPYTPGRADTLAPRPGGGRANRPSTHHVGGASCLSTPEPVHHGVEGSLGGEPVHDFMGSLMSADVLALAHFNKLEPAEREKWMIGLLRKESL